MCTLISTALRFCKRILRFLFSFLFALCGLLSRLPTWPIGLDRLGLDSKSFKWARMRFYIHKFQELYVIYLTYWFLICFRYFLFWCNWLDGGRFSKFSVYIIYCYWLWESTVTRVCLQTGFSLVLLWRFCCLVYGGLSCAMEWWFNVFLWIYFRHSYFVLAIFQGWVLKRSHHQFHNSCGSIFMWFNIHALSTNNQ